MQPQPDRKLTILQHLEKSAVRLCPAGPDGQLDPRHRRYIESFSADHETSIEDYAISLPDLDPSLVLNCVEWLLKEDRFDTKGGIDHMRQRIEAEYRETYDGASGWLARVPRVSAQLTLSFGVCFQVENSRSAELLTDRNLPTWTEQFQNRLQRMLARTPAELQRLFTGTSAVTALPHNPLLGPGEKLDSAYTGNLLDYSGCATAGEVRDLEQGDIPLGRYTFGFPDGFARDGNARPMTRGRDLFLSHDRTGKLMLYKGALICAPQNSGKTQMIYRWARAANRAGYNVFLVDVKGTMYRDLKSDLKGRVFHFTTDPRNDDSDGINFLADLALPLTPGPDGLRVDPIGTMRVRQLVEAILPKEGWEEGEQAYFYQNHVSWMAGLLQILLLWQHYWPEDFVDGEADLSYLYGLALDEELLLATVRQLCRMESALPPEKRVWPGVNYWTREIALLLSPAQGGQRTQEYSYGTLTRSIVNALLPFSENGTLFRKISRGRPDRPLPRRRFFSLEALNETSEPVTVILAAREQDLDDSRTVVSIAMKKMQHSLFNRMGEENPRPLLLLLDETRRIRGFSPADYITFARQAKAGCVLVYQSLDQIGDATKIHTILENIGLQIYLGSLVGATAEHFVKVLPRKRQATSSISQSRSGGQASQAVQTGYEWAECFTTAELYRLPAGRWPALMYINDLPRRYPILVDTDQGLI